MKNFNKPAPTPPTIPKKRPTSTPVRSRNPQKRPTSTIINPHRDRAIPKKRPTSTIVDPHCDRAIPKKRTYQIHKKRMFLRWCGLMRGGGAGLYSLCVGGSDIS